MRSLAALLAIAGCSFTPAYERPAAPVAGAFSDTTAGRAAADLGWRDVFSDPRLQALLELALRENRDLRLAALDVELVRAQHQIVRADLFPQINGVAAADVRGGANQFNPNATDVFTLYRIGGSVSWEIDLFGRLRDTNRAAFESYLASEQLHRAAHLSLVGELVTQYLRERAFDEQRVLAERTLAAVSETYAMTKRLLDAGVRSELDVRTAEAQVEAARAEVARVTRLTAQTQATLVQLVGAPLGNLPAAQPLESQRLVEDIGAGVPSDLLTRRPDILAAEHALRAANYNVGAARSAFLPNISLTGFAGLASTVLKNLFTGGLAWNFTPSISVPLFNGGRNRANLDISKVRKRIEIARYERAIQIAFREVTSALVARSSFDAQLAAQTARVNAEKARYEISEARYKNGVENYLTVLAAQQDLYAAQQQLIEVQFARLANLADLYRALGGGWRERS
jgi:multidrug efflux system outer membrane protein